MVIALRVGAAMLAAGLARLVIHPFVSPETLHVEVHAVGAYLAVIGGLYSIIAAFVIYVVWDQFNRVQLGLVREASALEDLGRVALFLSDRDSSARIRTAARQYMRSAAGDEARHLARGATSALAHEHFATLAQAVRLVEVKTDKDEAVYGELLAALRRALETRDERLSVSTARIPGTLWGLVVFGSLLVLSGFLVLGVRSLALSMGLVAAMGGAVAFLLAVVRDMDNPFTGTWNVSYAPMTAAAGRMT